MPPWHTPQGSLLFSCRFRVLIHLSWSIVGVCAQHSACIEKSHYYHYNCAGSVDNYTPRNEVWGLYWIHPACVSVCLSVCPLTFRVRIVTSTVQDGLFPYLVQIINSLKGCVACDDPWPWPLFSRSFGLDLENRVHYVASTVLDGLFLCLAQMITILEGVSRVTFFHDLRFWKFEFLANFWNISALTLTKIYSSRWILSIFSIKDH